MYSHFHSDSISRVRFDCRPGSYTLHNEKYIGPLSSLNINICLGVLCASVYSARISYVRKLLSIFHRERDAASEVVELPYINMEFITVGVFFIFIFHSLRI